MQDKKEIINEYKNRKQIGGICKITNTVINKIFIFTAPDIEASRNRFEFSKKTNSCINIKLQNDWNKYGSDSFTFEVIEELEKNTEKDAKQFSEDLNELLEIYIKNLTTIDMY
ncbi:MAG: nuclease family protein [Clostridia bacterium]|jgi:disulfide oxidoreductase YuzD|nr:nuclease family protein [Clostridia bacterium]